MVLTALYSWLRMNDAQPHSKAAQMEKNGLMDGNNVLPALVSAYERIPGIQSEIDATSDQLFSLKPCFCCRLAGKRTPARMQLKIYQVRRRLEAIKLNLEDAKKEMMLVSAFSLEPEDSSIGPCIRCGPKKHMFIALDGSDKQASSSSKAVKRASLVPPNSFKLYGRSPIVWYIARHLCSGDTTRSRVAILANAGMGKTAVAVKVMNDEAVLETFKSKHRFWVSCKNVTSVNTLLQTLKLSLRVHSNPRYSLDPLADIIDKLQTSDHPRLIVLDNVESLWHDAKPEEREGIQKTLYTLSWLSHVAILVTSNISPPGLSHEMHIPWQLQCLSPLDSEACRMIYTEICPVADQDKSTLNRLLRVLGPRPYDIKAMATYGKASGYSLPLLLANWKASGTKMFSENESGHCIGGFIASALMNEKPMVRSLLETLSLLPSGIPQGHLSWWVPTCTSNELFVIGRLHDLALLAPNSTQSISTYSFVRSYMEHSDYISARDRIAHYEAAFKIICDRNLFSAGSSSSKQNLQDLRSEATNLRHVLTTAAHARLRTNHPPAEARDNSYDNALLDSLSVFSCYQRADRDICLLTMQLAQHLNCDPLPAEAPLGLIGN